jgi:hypothetical protein
MFTVIVANQFAQNMAPRYSKNVVGFLLSYRVCAQSNGKFIGLNMIEPI